MKDTVAGFEVKKRTTWHPAKMTEVAFHPSCTKPDAQSDADFQRLKEDIAQNGIREPILVQASTGVVFAGRHRIKAAKQVGVPIPVVFLEISDSECWSYSRSQLCHRNLTPTRAASLYLEMKDCEEKAVKEENKQNAAEADEPEKEKPGKAKKEKPAKKERSKKGEGKKAKKEAKEAGVSTATMERVKKVREKAVPAVWKAMDDGTVTAIDAAYIADQPQEVQKAAIALVKEKKCKTLKAAHAILEKEEKRAAGPVLRDGLKQEVPKKLLPVFEDRGQFAVLREQISDISKSFDKLLKRESAKHIPKELSQHLKDIVESLDIYQPYAVDEKSEDGWICKRDATKK